MLSAGVICHIWLKFPHEEFPTLFKTNFDLLTATFWYGNTGIANEHLFKKKDICISLQNTLSTVTYDFTVQYNNKKLISADDTAVGLPKDFLKKKLFIGKWRFAQFPNRNCNLAKKRP